MKNNGIILFGATGLLGAHVRSILQNSQMHEQVYALSSRNVNFEQAGAAAEIIKTIRPSVVINCAAWTDVDKCEATPELADAINSRAVHEMAEVCRDIRSRFVHISTDFAYSGKEDAKPPYDASDEPEMLIGRDDCGVYAKTKRSGEVWAARAANYCIIRTSWLFGAHPSGKKTFPEWFVDTTLATIQEMRASKQGGSDYRKMLLLTDRFGSPSYAPDVAQAVVMIAASAYRGAIHVVNGTPPGFTGSQDDFGRYALMTFANSQPVKNGLTQEIGRDFKQIFQRVTQDDLVEAGIWKVKRPTDSRLLPSQLGGFTMRPFDLALEHFWRNRYVNI